jgi:hypothetical protein
MSSFDYIDLEDQTSTLELIEFHLLNSRKQLIKNCFPLIYFLIIFS